VGLDQAFFDLGGGSLQLIEVHAAICRLIDGPVPIQELFEHTTVRALARRLEGKCVRGAGSESAGERAARRAGALDRMRGARAGRS
jgi:hypothetical protein